MHIVENPTVTVTYRTAIKAPFVYFDLCLGIILDSLSCSFTSISFLTNTNLENNLNIQNMPKIDFITVASIFNKGGNTFSTYM